MKKFVESKGVDRLIGTLVRIFQTFNRSYEPRKNPIANPIGKSADHVQYCMEKSDQ